MPKFFFAVFLPIGLFIFASLYSPVWAESADRVTSHSNLPASDPSSFIVRKKPGMTSQNIEKRVKDRAQPGRALLNLVENTLLGLTNQPQPEIVLNRLQGLSRDNGVASQTTIVGTNYEVLTVSRTQNLSKAMSDFAQDPTVQSVQPNYLYHALTVTPNDPLYQNQWNLRNIRMPEAWEISQGNQAIKIAILDTGFNTQHEDFKDQNGNLLSSITLGGCFASHGDIPLSPPVENDDCLGTTNKIPAYQCAANNPTADDSTCTRGHGTQMAGIVKAILNNGRGVASIAPNVSLIAVKVLDRYGSGTSASVAAGLNSARQQGAKIISMSLGGSVDPCTAANPSGDCLVTDAISQAVGSGITVFAAAGNDNKPIATAFPANDPNVITVAATGQSDNRASYSNYGAGNYVVEVAAPGGDLDAFVASTGFGCNSGNVSCYPAGAGTSQATPHAAAVAALLLSRNPQLTPLQIKQILVETGDPVTTEQNKPIGKRVNALKALQHQLVGGAPTPTLSPTPGGGEGPTSTPTPVPTTPSVTPNPSVTAGPSPTPGPPTTYLAGKVTNLAPNVSLSSLTIEVAAVKRANQSITITSTPVNLQSDGVYLLSFTTPDQSLAGQNALADLVLKETTGRIVRRQEKFAIVIGQEIHGLNFSIYYCSRKFEGDANCDGVIDRKDYLIWKTEYHDALNSSLLIGRADFNGDGVVDLSDFIVFIGKNF